jgi:TRAP-type mannitol/chloroaromatic compound transport system permease small subunit
MLDSLLRLLDRVSRVAIIAGSGLIFAAAVLVSFDVIARKVVGTSLGGADELSGYALAISTTWGLAAVLLARGNVRVDALYQRLPARLRGVLDLVGLTALALFAVPLTRHGYAVLETSWELGALSNTPLKTPLWIPQALWVAGLVLFSVVLIALLLRAAVALVKGDAATVARLAGARSIQEEAAEEASHGERVAKELAQ